jgi:hypothetical protein
VGPPEACIIAGYTDNGETLVGWNFFQDMPEWAGVVEKEPCGYFRRRGWFEDPNTIALLAIGEQGEAPEERQFLRETLIFALELMETPRVHWYAGGFAAYDAWAALAKETEFPANAPLPMLMERLMCQCDAMTMVGEGRFYAAEFLKKESEAFPEAAVELLAAAQAFRRAHDLAYDMARLIGGIIIVAKQALNLARPDVRRAICDLIPKCAAADRKAAGHLHKALAQLA